MLRREGQGQVSADTHREGVEPGLFGCGFHGVVLSVVLWRLPPINACGQLGYATRQHLKPSPSRRTINFFESGFRLFLLAITDRNFWPYLSFELCSTQNESPIDINSNGKLLRFSALSGIGTPESMFIQASLLVYFMENMAAISHQVNNKIHCYRGSARAATLATGLSVCF